MSRRKAAPKRVILPDPLFRSQLLAKFINTVMRNGQKAIAERIVYGALDLVVRKKGSKKDEGGLDIRASQSAREQAIEIFKEALEKVTPVVEVKSRRVGGSTYQVPIEIRAERRLTLAMRWIVEYASKRNEKTMAERLANEILDALEGRGGAFKKCEDVHRMAKANQAFAHYRW